MSLQEYRRRRDFKATPEPGPDAGHASAGTLSFVVQLHHARARHFDFRLEHEGVLRSWAVPRGPSLRPSDKRLAVEVEDHPLAYGDFEGTIPQGEYGAGDVRIVDSGTWQPDGDAQRALGAGKLDFELRGTFLQGSWTLVRTGPVEPKAKWLLIKRDDAFAADTDLDQRLRDSEVAQRDHPEAGAPKAAKRHTLKAKNSTDWAARALALDGARVGRPDIQPQLALARDHAPDGDGWLHEIKWDGYRLRASVDHGTAQLHSRNGIDWGGRFPLIERELVNVPAASLQLDGELVVLDAHGHSSFTALQEALEGSGAGPLSCVLFDLLELDGVDVTGCRQLDRKALLRELLAARPSPWLAYGEHRVGNGPKVFSRALKDGHEGIISKRVNSPYQQGRSQHWIKLKGRDSLDATVVGFTLPKGSRLGIGALLLAVYEASGWRYVGRVGSGLSDDQLAQLRKALDSIAVDQPTLELPDGVKLPRGNVRWVEPRLVIEVEHRGWGKQGLLRQASFLRLRPDKSSRQPQAPISKTPTITHPERVVFPDAGVTKSDVAEYYQAVAPWLLRELHGRPVSLLRAPDGIEGEVFFQKHLQTTTGQQVQSLDVREKSGATRPYVMIEDAVGLLSLVQLNALEFHPWGCQPGEPERPDRMTFDLDPGAGVEWKLTVQAALDIRDHLERAGLRSHALLSGGKGVHVVVPLDGTDGWPAVKRFARALAYVLAEDAPERFVAVASKGKREGRIFIDWLRNGRGSTSVAPWSLRARPGAPVAMPVAWKALQTNRAEVQFDLARAVRCTRRLSTHPWGDYRRVAQRLPGASPRR